MPEKKTFHNIIGGEVQASADGAMMDIVNRRPGEVYASAPNSSAVDVDQACQAAGAAFEKSKSVRRFVTGFWRAHRHPIAPQRPTMTIGHDFDFDAMPKSMSVIEFGLVQWFNGQVGFGVGRLEVRLRGHSEISPRPTVRVARAQLPGQR
jgi:hypothetical protein